jgi:diguanylate cyclase (GGDEF)-like protein
MTGGSLSRRRVYATLGAFLAFGAPLGLLLVQALAAGRFSPGFMLAELRGAARVYAYVAVSTMVAFAAFGYALGSQADRLQRLARTDPLTGLLNRRAFQERLEEEWGRALRSGSQLSLLAIDLDGLKDLNDRAGHRGGDAALRSFALLLRLGSRITDVAARWGGDEFVVLAPQTGGDVGFDLAERIRASAGLGSPVGLSVSIGVATMDPRHPLAGPDALLSRGDAALYAAKRLGRDRVVAG